MQVDATVFTCISMLARAMGPGIQQDIKELLEPMLAVGLRWVSEASFPISGGVRPEPQFRGGAAGAQHGGLHWSWMGRMALAKHGG